MGLGCGFLGIQALIVDNINELAAGVIACFGLVSSSPSDVAQLQHYNNRTMEQANNSQSYGKIKHTDSLVYAQIKIM